MILYGSSFSFFIIIIKLKEATFRHKSQKGYSGSTYSLFQAFCTAKIDCKRCFIEKWQNSMRTIIFLTIRLVKIRLIQRFASYIIITFQAQRRMFSRPQPFLVCTQLLKTCPTNNSLGKQAKSTSLTLKSTNFKNKGNSKCQFQVQGIKLNQTQKQKKLNIQTSPNAEMAKLKTTPWFGEVPKKKKQTKVKEKLISATQAKSNTQLINFYDKNVFQGSNEYQRFNKLLKNKYFIHPSKVQFDQQAFNQAQSFLQQKFSSTPKRSFCQNSKLTDRDNSSINEKMAIQMFDPRLKHKRRPSSGDPLKRYKMSSMLARLRRGSICEGERSITLQLGHIEPLKYQQKIQQQTANLQMSVKPNEKVKQKIMKTQPTFRRSYIRQKQLLRSSGHQINPWSDDQWKSRNITEEQINVKLIL